LERLQRRIRAVLRDKLRSRVAAFPAAAVTLDAEHLKMLGDVSDVHRIAHCRIIERRVTTGKRGERWPSSRFDSSYFE
jgi:hypothetical protein